MSTWGRLTRAAVPFWRGVPGPTVPDRVAWGAGQPGTPWSQWEQVAAWWTRILQTPTGVPRFCPECGLDLWTNPGARLRGPNPVHAHTGPLSVRWVLDCDCGHRVFLVPGTLRRRARDPHDRVARGAGWLAARTGRVLLRGVALLIIIWTFRGVEDGSAAFWQQWAVSLGIWQLLAIGRWLLDPRGV